MNRLRSTKPLDAHLAPVEDALEISFRQQEDGGTPTESMHCDDCRIYLHIDGASSLSHDPPNNIPPRSVSFVPPRVPLTFSYAPGFRFICICVRAITLELLDLSAHFDTASEIPTTAEVFTQALTQDHTTITPSKLAFSQMVNLACMMHLELERRTSKKPSPTLALLLKLIMLANNNIKIDTAIPKPAVSQQDRQRHAIARAERYINENLANDITLIEAATAACLSPSYLTRLLKRELGRGFIDIVTERRLLLSCELISTTSLKFSAISRQCGFADETYFSRRFRQWYKCSPGQWRERHSRLLEPLFSPPLEP